MAIYTTLLCNSVLILHCEGQVPGKLEIQHNIVLQMRRCLPLSGQLVWDGERHVMVLLELVALHSQHE